ncbi:MAG TPA: Ig-like domain-containing protein, partial [Gemmatimonadaceae bacterium]
MRRLHWVGSSAALLLVLPAVACIDTAAPTFDAPVTVAAVTIKPAEASTNVGKQLPLSALTLDPSGHELDDQDIIWTSADTSVATVSASGEVTAKRIGSTVITATNGTKTGTATLTVLAPQVASVALSPASAALLAGDTARFAAEPRDDEAQPIAGRSVKWSVANPTIAKVAGGVLVGLAAGTTVVVATADGVSDSATVAVSARPVASVSIVPATVTLKSGKTTRLVPTALDDRGKPVEDGTVTWSSDNVKVATVSSTGTVSAPSTGTATISASVTAKGGNGKGKTGKGQVKVTGADAPVASVTVSPATTTLITGATQQLTATPKDSVGTALGGRTTTWATSNSAVATVSTSGLVTALAAGKATITATSEEKSGSSAITVTLPPVASVAVSPSSAQILVGKTVTLSAATLDATGKTLTGRSISWSSGTSSVATVSSSGVVSGVAAGSAWIFATSEGQRDSASITVTLAPVATVSISPSSASLTAGGTQALTVTLKDASGATLTGRSVTWISSDKAVATVSSAGLVTAVAAG